MAEFNVDIDMYKLPRHIAIIMDGNGRWAKDRGMTRVQGHREGAESVRVVVRTCRKLGIGVLTLYAFSQENWQRPQAEINALMELLVQYLRSERDEMMENGIQLKALGEIEQFPQSVLMQLHKVIKQTEGNRKMVLNLALSYGGRSEIVHAAQKISEECLAGKLEPKMIDEALFSGHLYTGSLPDPDLLIRTSGEFRISNFLLWQIAYTEIHITPVYWPDFREAQLIEAIRDYQSRERRFGKISEQI
jgi:undecaprenyl diphosphate synthase